MKCFNDLINFRVSKKEKKKVNITPLMSLIKKEHLKKTNIFHFN